MKTEHLTGHAAHTNIFLVARRVAQLFHISSFIQGTCIGSRLDESCQHVSRVLKTVRLVHNLIVLSQPPERRFTFPDGLETESGIPCIDPSGGGWFGRVAEQSPLTGQEPKNLARSPANTTEAESELSLGSESFSHRVNDQVRKRQNQSSSSTLQASVSMGKNYSDNWHSINNTEDLTM